MGKSKKKVKNNNQIPQAIKARYGDFFLPDAELDFHDMGILDDYMIEKYLSDFLQDSYVSGLNNLLVITGKGSRVKPVVSRSLSKNKYVKKFNQAGYFHGQEGAFEVYL